MGRLPLRFSPHPLGTALLQMRRTTLVRLSGRQPPAAGKAEPVARRSAPSVWLGVVFISYGHRRHGVNVTLAPTWQHVLHKPEDEPSNYQQDKKHDQPA